jgi:biopolymer transport protein ExbB/TolQ
VITPNSILTANTILYALRQSDGFAISIVGMLFLMSIYAWIIMCDKGLAFTRMRAACKQFLDTFEPATSPLELALRAEQFSGPIAEVYRAGLDEVMDVLKVKPELVETYCRRRTLPRTLTVHEIDKVRSTLERTVAAQVLEMESQMGTLGTIVAISPFLGLLGTVWGVMLAFIGMAQKGRPDLNAIAPGVSGALLTTVVGLFVAIPALVGNNMIANTVRRTTVEMDNFVEDFIALLKLQEKES